MPIEVQAYTARTDDDWTAGSMILDTGATAHLMKTTINKLLAHQRASDLTVQGAFGSQRKPAAIRGLARMYILNVKEPEQHGTPLEHNVDTLDGLCFCARGTRILPQFLLSPPREMDATQNLIFQLQPNLQPGAGGRRRRRKCFSARPRVTARL